MALLHLDIRSVASSKMRVMLFLRIFDRQQAMEGLATAFDTFESDAAESIIKELSEYTRHGHSCKELLEKICRCVEDFDFDAAGEELHRLLGEGEIL